MNAIEKLKAMEAAATPNWYPGGRIAKEDLDLIMTVRPVLFEILAVLQAVEEDILDEEGNRCECSRPVCAAMMAFHAKAAEVLK